MSDFPSLGTGYSSYMLKTTMWFRKKTNKQKKWRVSGGIKDEMLEKKQDC